VHKMVHRMVLVRFGGKYVHLLKMFGALLTFGAAFKVLGSAYALSQAIDAAIMAYPVTIGDVFGAITSPIGDVFMWLGFMVIGLALYRADRTIIPIEEDIKTKKK